MSLPTNLETQFAEVAALVMEKSPLSSENNPLQLSLRPLSKKEILETNQRILNDHVKKIKHKKKKPLIEEEKEECTRQWIDENGHHRTDYLEDHPLHKLVINSEYYNHWFFKQPSFFDLWDPWNSSYNYTPNQNIYDNLIG